MFNFGILRILEIILNVSNSDWNLSIKVMGHISFPSLPLAIYNNCTFLYLEHEAPIQKT